VQPEVTPFFDPETFSYSYVVNDPATRKGIVIDPVHNFDPASGALKTTSADEIIQFVREQQLDVQWVLETHIHADHLSSLAFLSDRLDASKATGANVSRVQCLFSETFNAEAEFRCDGSQFDRLFDDNDIVELGELTLRVLHTPGHTPACVTYLIGDCAFVGDTLFMPDYGTARTDFPGGNARTLYRSIQRILDLPATTRLFMGHDYGTKERKTFQCESTVEEQLNTNIHLAQHRTEEDFTAFRMCRDQTLSAPRLLYPAVQYNMRGGQLPPAEDNGLRYLKIPVQSP